MAPGQDPIQLKQAIVESSPDARSLLFLWLTSEPAVASDYFEVATTLHDVKEWNLAHLVVHRGLALFPESDPLARFALRLELESRPQAA